MTEQHAPLTTDWLETISGKRFNPFDPEPELSLRDLVWGCARMPRYNGQFKEEVDHYSVAEHLVLLTRKLAEDLPAWVWEYEGENRKLLRTAACHDLQEGVIGDMVRPLKRSDPFYCKAEDALCVVLARRYDLSLPLPARVKEFDNRILVDERRQAMNPSPNSWAIDGLEPIGVELQFWSPRRAAAELFDLLDKLGVRE